MLARSINTATPADATFIDALGFDFRNAPTIARHMLAKGSPTTLSVIRQRMAEFATYTSEIEAKGDSWRIVPPEPANDNSVVLPPVPANDNADALSINIHHGCGLELMRSMPDASVPFPLIDLPYGMTGLSIDPKIDVEEWMVELRRIVTDRGAIVAFAAQPFATDLMNAGRDIFKQELIWAKTQPTGYQQSRARHLKAHENILVFSKGTVAGKRSDRQMVYNPQGARKIVKVNQKACRTQPYLKNPGSFKAGVPYEALENCPRSILYYPKDSKGLHPFAKPVALLEYLIRTYSNEGDLVFDPTMGSGSAGVAALNTGRTFLGAENGIDDNGRCMFTIAKNRIAAALATRT